MHHKLEVIKTMSENGATWKEIAEFLSCRIGSVRYVAKKNKILKTRVIRRRWTSQQMLDALKSSNSIADVLRKIGLAVRPGNYQTVWNFIKNNEVSIEHMDPFGAGKRRISSVAIPLEDVLIENSRYNRKSLKKRLLKDGLLKNECSICGRGEWLGKPLIMILDHINGKNDDNRIENLRMLCPNCDSQQDTFCRGGLKKKKIRKKKINHCQDCGTEIWRTSKFCKKCADKNHMNKSKYKVPHPSKEELSIDINKLPWVAIGKKYGVSDNAVRKWARRYGILE